METKGNIINIRFGSACLCMPNSKEWIEKVRKLLDLLEEDIGEEESKEYENSCGCSACKSEKLSNLTQGDSIVQSAQSIEEEGVHPQGGIGAGKESTLQVSPSPQDGSFQLIPKFEWDKSKEKSYRTIFFVEEEDGRVGLLYFTFKTFTTKEAVLSIPFPVPYGYTPLKSFSGNRKAAIRLYREYLFNEARNAEVPGAIKRDEEQEEKDATKREEALRRKAEINATRWKGDKSKREMSVRTKELRDGVVAKMKLGVVPDTG